MSRLPIPGGDNGNWGVILNDYLSREHNADGSLKIRDEGIPATIADGSITASKLSSSLNSYIANAQTAVQSVNGKTGQSVTLAAADISDVVADAEKGTANGVATLDGTSKLTTSQLPSSVVNTTDAQDIAGLKTFTDGFRSDDGAGNAITMKPNGDGTAGIINWIHDDASGGYLIHLVTSSHVAHTGSALIGMGIDYDGQGILISNKATGRGLVVSNNSTITGSDAYGINVFQGSNTAPAVRFEINSAAAATAADLFQLQAFGSPGASTRLLYVGDPNGQAGEILAANGQLHWLRDIRVQDDNSGNVRALQVQSQSNATAGNIHRTSVLKQGVQFEIDNGAGSQWGYRWQGNGSHLVLQTSPAGSLGSARTWTTVVDIQAGKFSVFGATAAAQQTGGAATANTGTYGATEAAMLQKAYDALRTFGFLS